MGTKCLACSRIPTRCVWRNLSPQANEVWRYDHKSLWKPFTQPALLVQQFKHHNMRSAVMPSMSLAKILFWGYPFNIWLGWSAIVLHKINYSKNMLDLFTTMGQILWDSMFLMIFSYRLRLLYIMAVFFNSFQLCPRTKTGYHTIGWIMICVTTLYGILYPPVHLPLSCTQAWFREFHMKSPIPKASKV